MRHWKTGVGVVAALATGAAGLSVIRNNGAMMGGAARAATAPPAFVMPVPVVPVAKKAVPVYREYTARTEAIRSISIMPRISGYIQKQDTPDGADVREGDLLYTIDPRDVQAALDQVKAQMLRDKAALEYARSNLNRGAALVGNGFLAKDTYDQRASAQGQAEAVLAMDDAAMRTAELNLSYTQVRAPFSGRLGRNQASVGTLVSPGGSALNTLVQLSPIYVTFNPSETDLAELAQAKAAGKVMAEVSVGGHDQERHTGELTFLDNSVDRATGTIMARATIANLDRSILPGQYVHVRISLHEIPNALIVPQAAIGSSQLGKYVYIVSSESKVEQRLVSLGPTDGEGVVISSGVTEGDNVITGNLQKIGPGASVKAQLAPSSAVAGPP
jgi:membrane fusion protein, multidrug efflux system